MTPGTLTNCLEAIDIAISKYNQMLKDDLWKEETKIVFAKEIVKLEESRQEIRANIEAIQNIAKSKKQEPTPEQYEAMHEFFEQSTIELSDNGIMLSISDVRNDADMIRFNLDFLDWKAGAHIGRIKYKREPAKQNKVFTAFEVPGDKPIEIDT